MEINAHVEERDRHFDELTHQEEEPKLLRLLYLVWYDKEPYSDELYSANLPGHHCCPFRQEHELGGKSELDP